MNKKLRLYAIFSISIIALSIVFGFWIKELLDVNSQLKVIISEKNKETNLRIQEVEATKLSKVEVRELLEFLIDTQDAIITGKKLFNDFNSPNTSSIDFTQYSYPTEKRVELVDKFLEYQKKYPKEQLQKFYNRIGLNEDVSKHQSSIEYYLNYSVKVRDRKNDPQGILLRLDTIKADAQVESAIVATQKKIIDLLK